jgi:translocation and assembly module TamB
MATIDGAFNSGQGVGLLKGSFDWKDAPRLQLNLKVITYWYVKHH